MAAPDLVTIITIAKAGISLLRDMLPASEDEEAAPPKPPDAGEGIRRLREELGVTTASPHPKTPRPSKGLWPLPRRKS